MGEYMEKEREGKDIPAHKVLRLRPQRLIGRELQEPLPVDNLGVRCLVALCAKRRPANQAFESDCPNGPPVAGKVVAGL